MRCRTCRAKLCCEACCSVILGNRMTGGYQWLNTQSDRRPTSPLLRGVPRPGGCSLPADMVCAGHYHAAGTVREGSACPTAAASARGAPDPQGPADLGAWRGAALHGARPPRCRRMHIMAGCTPRGRHPLCCLPTASLVRPCRCSDTATHMSGAGSGVASGDASGASRRRGDPPLLPGDAGCPAGTAFLWTGAPAIPRWVPVCALRWARSPPCCDGAHCGSSK